MKEVFAMSVTDYNARLYEKMKTEQDKYRAGYCIRSRPKFSIIPTNISSVTMMAMFTQMD